MTDINKLTKTELKALAYDVLSEIEYSKKVLIQINGRIAQLQEEEAKIAKESEAKQPLPAVPMPG